MTIVPEERTSFCRICLGGCGTRLRIDVNGHITEIRPDGDQPLARGYACSKGMEAEDAHHGSSRLLRPLKRVDGRFIEIGLEQALDEIAERLRPHVEGNDPDSVALFSGNASTMAHAAYSMRSGFLAALGSRSLFTATTIDQPGKLVAAERLGSWRAGLQGIAEADVALLFGTNPVVSHSTGGFLFADPARRLKQARARGLKLIVVDPRVSETARQADLHLQCRPGQDVAIASAMIRLILAEGWHDAGFTDRFVTPGGLAALREAVAPFEEERVEKSAGLPVGTIARAAAMFARDGRRGAAYAATGPSFAPFGTLAQHLINCLNVVCGRYRRAGDAVPVDPTRPSAPVHEEVTPPSRMFERVPPSRIRGAGLLFGERLTATLPDEILTPGKGQVRCLILSASNPMASIPDTTRVREALRALDLLVAITPYMTASAREADFILPPKLQYERADLNASIPGIPIYADNWAQYTPALIPPPAGSDVCDDWYPYWAVAKRLGRAIDFLHCGALPLDIPPTTDELLAIRMQGARVSFEELRRYPSGHVWTFPDATVLPARLEHAGRFDVMPADVRAETAAFIDTMAVTDWPGPGGFRPSHLLSARRNRHVHCTVGIELASARARMPYNPLYLHPDDLLDLGAAAGDKIRITSDRGRVAAIAAADATMRRGCAAMSFGWSGEAPDPGAEWDGSANINRLIACDRDTDAVTALPRMSAIPVRLERVDGPAQVGVG